MLNESDSAVSIEARPVTWKMAPSSNQDMLVDAGGEAGIDEFHLRLADAGEVSIVPYATGFKNGIKIVLDRFRNAGQLRPGSALSRRLILTMCVEGEDEEVFSEATVIEHKLVVRELNWPTAVDGREVDFTVIPSDDGTLLPRNWPKLYHPIHRAEGDHSIIQSHLSETWAMSWWGFENGSSAMTAIVETSDDAAYTFSHPPGGPTFMGPIWRAPLGHFGICAVFEWCFFRRVIT